LRPPFHSGLTESRTSDDVSEIVNDARRSGVFASSRIYALF